MERDHAFFHANAAPSGTRWWCSDAALAVLCVCVIGTLVLVAWGLSKSRHRYEPTRINHEASLYEFAASGRFLGK
jgi:hypothetical protein